MPQPHLRAADADRTAVADVLGAHMSTGRLTVAEYDERLARAYAARTYGELAELTADLPPGEPLTAAATPAEPAPARAATAGAWWAHGWCGGLGPHGRDGSVRAAWLSWASTALVVLGIWGLSMIGSQGWVYPWPVWVIGPWGLVVLSQSLAGTGRGRRPHRDALPAADRGH